MGLVSQLVPPLSRDQQKQGIAQIVRDFNREGMTGAKDPGIGAAKWELYQELLNEGQLTVRVFALWSGARRLEDRAAVHGASEGEPAASRPGRRRHAGVGRREDVHGRQRRRAHRLDARRTGTAT